MKKSLLGLALTFGLVGALNAQDVDVLALVTKGAVSDNSKGVKVLSLDEMKQVKCGYYWTTGLVDISHLTHDNLGNVYGEYIARGTVTPDQTDMFWQKYYFEVEFYRSYDNPRFSNRREEHYIFIPYDYNTRKPYKVDSNNRPMGISADDMYKIDPGVYVKSRAPDEASTAVYRYQQQVIHGL